MDRIVCYIPSYNDSQRACESLASLADWQVVISDNGSLASHRKVLKNLASDRVEVVRQEASLGRVGNWKFCVEHFIASGATWMKFLMAGDVHRPGSLEVYRRAIAECPQARLIVGQIESVLPDRRERWGISDQLLLLPADSVLALAAGNDNVFHSLDAPLFHVDLVRDGFEFGESVLDFSADLHFLLRLARGAMTLYVPEIVAEFFTGHRQQFQSRRFTLEHYFEEGLMRLQALQDFQAINGDQRIRQEVTRDLHNWLRDGLANRLRGPSGEHLAPGGWSGIEQRS